MTKHYKSEKLNIVINYKTIRHEQGKKKKKITDGHSAMMETKNKCHNKNAKK